MMATSCGFKSRSRHSLAGAKTVEEVILPRFFFFADLITLIAEQFIDYVIEKAVQPLSLDLYRLIENDFLPSVNKGIKNENK